MERVLQNVKAQNWDIGKRHNRLLDAASLTRSMADHETPGKARDDAVRFVAIIANTK